MSSHTPGPWRATFSCGTNRVASEHSFVADCGFVTNESTANVRLLAAAPDLLVALRALMPFAHGLAVNYGIDELGNSPLAEALRAGDTAIAKAVQP